MAIDFPANPTNGQVYANYIYDSSITAWRNVNTDTGIGTLNAMGLKNVVPTSIAVGSGSATVNANGTVTFTGASSISLNGCFSSAYTNYRVILAASASAHGSGVFFRARKSGVDTSNQVYFFGGSSGNVGGVVNGWSSGSSGTFAHQIGVTSIEATTSSVDVCRPYTINERTTISALSFGFSSTYMSINTTGMVYDLYSYDGLTIYLSAGTFGGTLTVYGYNN